MLKQDAKMFVKTVEKDFTELQNPAEEKLSDNELDMATGGQGQFGQTHRNRFGGIMKYTVACDYAPDDQTFKARYDQNPTDCPNYVWSGNGCTARVCDHCANYHIIP